MGQTQCCADIPAQYYNQNQKSASLRQRLNRDLSHFKIAEVPKMHPQVKRINDILYPFKPTNFQPSKSKSIETRQLNQNGTIYSGTMANGFPEGIGQLYYPDQSYYIGIFRNGVGNIEGRYINPSGWYYQGQIQNEQAQGRGTYVNEKLGYKYEGEFKGDLPNGTGKETWQEKKAFYQGQFLHGRKHGLGHYKNPNWQYAGNFNNNQVHFKGKITYYSGESYQGDFKNGRKHGYGVYKWPDTSQYQGWYKNDIKHGTGKYTTPKGQIFEGEWYEGRRQNNGILKVDGKTFNLRWKNDIVEHS